MIEIIWITRVLKYKCIKKDQRSWFPNTQLKLSMDYTTGHDVTSSLQDLFLMSTTEGPRQEGTEGGGWGVFRFKVSSEELRKESSSVLI